VKIAIGSALFSVPLFMILTRSSVFVYVLRVMDPLATPCSGLVFVLSAYSFSTPPSSLVFLRFSLPPASRSPYFPISLFLFLAIVSCFHHSHLHLPSLMPIPLPLSLVLCSHLVLDKSDPAVLAYL